MYLLAQRNGVSMAYPISGNIISVMALVCSINRVIGQPALA